MTTIVGVIDGSKVWIGGDRGATIGSHTLRTLSRPKLFSWTFESGDRLVMGLAGDTRVLNAVYNWQPPEVKSVYMNADDYIYEHFLPAFKVMAVTKELLYENPENGKEFYGGGCVVGGFRNRLFELCDNLALNEMEGGMLVCGSGSHFALGALAALPALPPEQRLLKALEVAARFDPYSQSPFDILST